MTLFRAFATVGGMTMLSRVLGFIRDILIAGLVGAGLVADVFFVAFKLPNFFRRLFAEGAFNAGFVPMFSRLLTTDGRAHAERFASEAFSVLLTVLLGLLALFEIAMPWVMQVLAPGFLSDPEKFELAIAFTRITFPYLLFISLVSLLAGVLNSLQKFAAAAFAPVLLNICLIAAMLLIAPLAMDHGLPSVGHILPWGVAVAGLVQFIWLAWNCRRAGVALRLLRPRLTADVKKLLVLILPVALGAGVVQVNLVIDIMLASLLGEGAVSFLFYADRLNQLPIGVVGVAVGTALLPLLSRQLAEEDEAAAAHSLNRALELTLLLSLPAAAAFMAVPGELISALFQRGAFGETEARATAFALAAYAVGLPSYVMVKALGPAYFARHDTRTPVKLGLIALAVNLVLNLILMQFLAHAGLALATALASWLNAGMLAAGLYRAGLWSPDRRLRRRLAGALGASLCMAVLLSFLSGQLQDLFEGGEAMRAGALALLVLAGLLSYGGLAFVFGAVRPADLKSMLRKSGG